MGDRIELRIAARWVLLNASSHPRARCSSSFSHERKRRFPRGPVLVAEGVCARKVVGGGGGYSVPTRITRRAKRLRRLVNTSASSALANQCRQHQMGLKLRESDPIPNSILS